MTRTATKDAAAPRHLTNGWEPELASTDTLTRAAVLASADRVRHAATASGRPCAADDRWVAAYQAERGFLVNSAVLIEPPTDWARLVRAMAQIVPSGRPMAITSAWPTPDLAPFGFELVGHPPFMVRPPGPAPVAAPAELEIAEVLDPVGLERFERTVIDGFPIDDLQPYQSGSIHGAAVLGGPTHFFVGSVAGQHLATAAGHLAFGVNLIEMVATLPPQRGRGYGGALTMAAACIDPTKPAVLIASDAGRPVYERLGFLPISRWTVWHRR